MEDKLKEIDLDGERVGPELEFGYDSDRQSSRQHVVNQHVRLSLTKLQGVEAGQQEIMRTATQKDIPVQTGNGEETGLIQI